MKKGFRLFLTLTPLLFVIDQLVKVWARDTAKGIENTSLGAPIPGVFELKLVYNEGVAFGMFQGAGLLLAPVAVAITIIAAWYSWKNDSEKSVSHVTAALLASGALGNLVDRLAHGKVTDMFWIRAINFPVFNIADVCITIAGALLVLGAVGDLAGQKNTRREETRSLTAGDESSVTSGEESSRVQMESHNEHCS